MLPQLILARSALAARGPDLQRHADMYCRVGNWRKRFAARATSLFEAVLPRSR